MTTFERACALLDTALKGGRRRQILDDVSRSKEFGRALLRLRESMRSHVWNAGDQPIALDRIVEKYDRLTRQEGLHALHDWDGKADRVNEEMIAVDVLNYVAGRRGAEPTDRVALAVLLDYYFLYLLALLSLRIWDEGNPDENLDRLGELLRHLQDAEGSGQPFAGDPETLILIATSHYELDERGYDQLLVKVRTLNRPHRVRIALGHAPSMGCHLRFGFEATYARDTGEMRNDNVADYPWLCFALTTLMKEFSRLQVDGSVEAERERVAEAMLNGLTADARAFVGAPPASLASCEAERLEFRDLFFAHRAELLEMFERFRPSPGAYSPISFFFNFSHNVLKGTIVDVLLSGEPWNLTFNDLLTARSRDEASREAKEALAVTLMGYARSNPDRIRGRMMPVIVYDPGAGRQAFSVAMRKLKE